MRIGKRGFRARIKGILHITFGAERLTTYAGLELVRRFLRRQGLFDELRRSQKALGVGGDLCFVSVVLTVLGMLLVGAKRLRHLSHLCDDPLVLRFAGLGRLPTARSLSRALKRLNYKTWPELDRLCRVAARWSLDGLELRRWTIDIDGSVLTTGLKVRGAVRGFNPHHRKNPSYYPILATLAQTGHVVGHRNRRGNVHDSHRSADFLRETVRRGQEELGMRGTIEARADSAFFKRDFLEMCERLGLEYAVKVPMWPWLNLRAVVALHGEDEWKRVDREGNLEGLVTKLPIEPWDRSERIAIYRKRVNHKPAKGRQLELFNPDDGHWEYSVVATNKTLGLRALWHFQAGRGVQEKTIGELKNGYAFAAVPTQTYRANTAWQKLNILAHNVMTSLQLMTTAPMKSRTAKRTGLYKLSSIGTLRFEWIVKAGRLLRPAGKPVLRLVDNSSTRCQFERLERALAEAA